MNNGIRRGGVLLLLFVFILIFAGCRQSPMLEEIIYIDKVEEEIPEELPEEEEIPEPEEEDKGMDQKSPGTAAPKVVAEEPGEVEFQPDPSDEESEIQVAGDEGKRVEVPESSYMVTTVSESTKNPHWKRSIVYDDQRYTGEWADGFFEGVGTYLWDDGDKYEGDWRNGMFNGKGAYTWAVGDLYEGDWKTETFHGEGKYTWASGSFYDGEWFGGVKEGYGIYSWANGDKYTGTWKAGVKEGMGTYVWADGSVYEGEWKYGIKDGQGSYRGADGTVFKGLWANDKFVGQ